MRFGLKCEDGFLPVYSVGSEKEARALLTMCCGTNNEGEFVARELMNEQNMGNLLTFGLRLHKMHELLVKQGRCDCREDG